MSAACAECSNEEYFAPGEAYWADPFKDETGWLPKPRHRGEPPRGAAPPLVTRREGDRADVPSDAR